MSRNLNSVLGRLAAFAVLTLSACHGPRHEFAEVEGKVTLEGKPLHGAIVRFYPVSEDKEQPPVATGLTDADGAYKLTHGPAEPGALVGVNRVVVYWPSRDLRGDGPAPSRPIPTRYASPIDSPLTFDVKAGARQTINLALEE
jgi:hypothetical protein